MRTDTVGLKDSGKIVVVIVESHLVPVPVIMNGTESAMSVQGWATIAATNAARSARRLRRRPSSVTDVVPLPPRSSSPTVAGCRLGGYPAGRDRWGGKRVVGGVLPRINIGADVWGESSIMTGVYERWCSSTLHIRWGLCERLCLVFVCRGRYGLGRVVLLFILELNLGGVGPERGLRGGGRRGWCEE
jgi:hypothetical protein